MILFLVSFSLNFDVLADEKNNKKASQKSQRPNLRPMIFLPSKPQLGPRIQTNQDDLSMRFDALLLLIEIPKSDGSPPPTSEGGSEIREQKVLR